MTEILKTEDGVIEAVMPEGFRLMSDTEAADAGQSELNMIMIKNDRKHFMMSFSCRKLNFLAKALSLKTALNDHEKKIESASAKQKLNYRKLASSACTVDSEEAASLRYEYTVQNTVQVSEYVLVKHNGYYCGFSCAARKENFEENYHLFEELLSKVKLH